MLRTFFFLLSFVTDYETVTSIPHIAFTIGLLGASLLGCFGIRRALRSPVNGDASNAA